MAFAPSKNTHPFRYALERALAKEEAERLMAAVPGTYAFGNVAVAPVNAAWLLERALDHNHVRFQYSSPPPALTQRIFWRDVQAKCFNEVTPAPAGRVRGWVDAFLTDYQKRGILYVLNSWQQSGAMHWPTGAGKSLGAVIWALFDGGNALVVTKAAARRTLFNEFTKYSLETPLILLPKSERPKNAPDPVEILRNGAADLGPMPRVVIVAWESLADYIDEIITYFPYTSLVMDEAHKAKMHKRWSAVPGTDPNARPEFRQLKNVATAAQKASANARRRLEMTATPIPDRVRDLWAQLDLMHPRCWGRAWDWFNRYCDVVVSTFGNLDNSGKSNTEELRQRMSFHCHVVDSFETRRSLPPMRRQVTVIPKAMQSKPGGFARELERARKQGRKNLIEVRLAEAASRKRDWIVDLVSDSVGKDGKVVVFTGRHADCERLEDAIKAALGKTKQAVTVWMAHGEHGTAYRDEVRDAFMAHPGPCVLVGTGDAWGESFNLQDTDLAVFAQLPINYRQLWQWEGRFQRHGQKRPVLIVYPVAEASIDERLQSILLDKLPAVAALHGDSGAVEAEQALFGAGREDEIIDALFAAVMTAPEAEEKPEVPALE